ncbi:sialate O-acetylesterase [Mucilaginibacter sp.]|jgi:sialate O-acetylesterase|uniref:sialate O-acetylesterase n=1 Tax=Mucilaginibacter sp. TaxID=1882438 RepID=UPI00356775E1
MKVLFVILSVCLFTHTGYAQLSTSKLFNDHMVLQRNHDIPVWGKAGKGAKITININNSVKTAIADVQGNWKATLAPMKEGGPYTMKISSGSESVTYTDVMLGEVWICSGQSNMEFQLKNASGYKEEQSDAGKVAVRQFLVPHKVSLTPVKDLAGGEWTVAAPNTIDNFTAVGYFYAKQLAQNLHVTVGIINSSWGGTEAEDWISQDAMEASPEFKAVVPTLPRNEKELNDRADKRLKAYAYHDKPVVNYTIQELATKPANFFDNWQPGNAPGSWDWMGKLYSYRGEGFMQRTINLDSSTSLKSSILNLGPTNANITVYINGKTPANIGKPTDNKFSLPAGTWKSGANSMVINFLDQRSTLWFNIGFSAPANDLNISFADTTIKLADYKWRVMPDLSKPYHFDFLPNNTAFDLYNAMVRPLIPYAVAGVIWYQGEANVDRAYQYRTALPLLINDWRNKWQQQFPFLIVQVSSLGGSQNSNAGSKWAELREAQNMTLKLPNTGIAVTTDIGDPLNVHPKDKANVGYRLAGVAFNRVYHLPGFYESPQLASSAFASGYAMVSFTHADDGLTAKGQNGNVKGFELAGADHKFYYAQAAITGNKVKVWSDKVANPVAVRYAWTDAPVDANLFNSHGLPANPFRTDDWPGLTVAKKFE